jgi:hypothetical protein
MRPSDVDLVPPQAELLHAYAADIQACFEALLDFIATLSEEEDRAAREGLGESLVQTISASILCWIDRTGMSGLQRCCSYRQVKVRHQIGC